MFAARPVPTASHGSPAAKLGRVGLHEVARAFDDHGVVVGEDLLPTPSLLGSEGQVGVAPTR